MERILVVSNDFPYPPNNGGALDTWGRIQTLKKLGYSVDLVATVRAAPSRENIEAAKQEVDQLFIVERERGLKAALSWQPFQLRSRAGLRTVALSHEYAAVVMDAEHVTPILQNQRLRARKRILRIQNNEVHSFQEMSRSSKSLIEKVFYRSEAVKFMVFSPYLKSKADVLWFISDFEMKEHLKNHPTDCGKSVFVPHAVHANSMRRQALNGQTVLFLGTLALSNNARAVEWYISNVHPFLSDLPDYRFVVAGNTRGMSTEALHKMVQRHQNIIIYENPKDIQVLYGDSAVFINPVFRGAGLKLKTIDAIQAGLPVVATSTALEGSRLVHEKHVLVGDSPTSFTACVRRLLNDKDLGRSLVAAAQNFLVKEYDTECIVRRSLAT
jgi:polysaccharide biosynthesis protein PslH